VDTNGDGFVSLNPDVQNLLNSNGSIITSGNYSHFVDLNGDGIVSLNPDVQILLNQSGTALPGGEPSGPGVVTAGASAPSAPGTVAPSVLAIDGANETTAALERVIAIPPRGRTAPRHFSRSGFASVKTLLNAGFVDVPGTSARPQQVSRGVSGRAGSAEDSIDLLTEVSQIF